MPTIKPTGFTPGQLRAFGKRLAKIATEIQDFGGVLESHHVEEIVIPKHSDGATRSLELLTQFRAQVELETDAALLERGAFHTEKTDEDKPKSTQKTDTKRTRKKL